MENFFITQLWGGVELFFNSIDGLFLILFILTTSIINFGSKNPTKYKWLNWWNQYPSFFVFIFGLLLAGVYGYLNGFSTKVDMTRLFYSIIFAMVLWKLVGINRIEKWIQTKFWNSTKP